MKIIDIIRVAIKILGLKFFFTYISTFLAYLSYGLELRLSLTQDLLPVIQYILMIALSLVLIFATDWLIKLLGLTKDPSLEGRVHLSGDKAQLLRVGVMIVGTLLVVNNIAKGVMCFSSLVYEQYHPGMPWRYASLAQPGEGILAVLNIALGLVLLIFSSRIAGFLLSRKPTAEISPDNEHDKDIPVE